MSDLSTGLTSSAGRAFAEWVSRAFGWGYTTLWAISFIPQIIHSQRTHSVSGVSSDFIALNVFGFLSYLSATMALLVDTTVRKEYSERHDGFPPLVRWNDAAFAAWASLCALIQLWQALAFHNTANPVSRANKSTLSILLFGALAGLVVTDLSGEYWWEWLDFVNFLFWCKIYVSLVKYWPQVSLNAHKQSFKGLRVENLFADLGGGLLSLAQLVLDAALEGDWSGITGHPAKLGIALIALVWDGILIIQWATYDKTPQANTRTPHDEEAGPSEPTERTTLVNGAQS